MHLFKADNQTQFNEWFKFLEKVISNSYNSNDRKNSAQKPKEDSSFFVYTNNNESIAQCNGLANNSLNNSMSSLSSTSSFDSIKISSFNSSVGTKLKFVCNRVSNGSSFIESVCKFFNYIKNYFYDVDLIKFENKISSYRILINNTA